MHKIGAQTFCIARSFVGLSYFGIWFFGAFAALSISLGVIDYMEDPENTSAIIVYVFMTMFFFGFAYGTFRVTRQFKRAPVTVDEDGIWPTYQSKRQGLIKWSDVGLLKERQYGQRLELFSKDEVTLIKLEYQLEGFEVLREIVLAKTHQPHVKIDCPVTLKKSIGYHVFTIGATFGLTALSYYVGKMHLILGLLLFGVVVVLSTFDYLKTVTLLTVNRRTLDIRYPLRKKTIGPSDVSSIYLSDQFVKGSRHPEVIVTCHSDEKPIRLRQLGTDASALYELLDRWNNEKLFT